MVPSAVAERRGMGMAAVIDPWLLGLEVVSRLAQEAAFVDERHYAVGRWDGTLSLFAFTDSPSQGMVPSAVAERRGMGMAAVIDPWLLGLEVVSR
jgi:hypothetical protein